MEAVKKEESVVCELAGAVGYLISFLRLNGDFLAKTKKEHRTHRPSNFLMEMGFSRHIKKTKLPFFQ